MESLLPYITGAGGALVVLALVAWAFYNGKLHSDSEFQKVVDENDGLKRALETERTANNELARAGGVTNKLIGALVDVATERQAGRPRSRRRNAGNLTPEDLGL